MRVTFNVDATFWAPMDRGRVRSAADIIGSTERNTAIAGALILLETREPRFRGVRMIQQTLEHHEAGIAWARTALPMRRGVTANLVAAFVYAWPVSRAHVESFARSFNDLTGTGPTDPVVVLRRHIARLPSTSSAKLSLTLATLRCLHAHCEGQPITRLNVNEQGFEYFAGLRGGRQ